MRLETPTIMTSSLMPANSFSVLGTRMRPRLSTPTSVAPEKNMRLNFRPSAFVNGICLKRLSTVRHSDSGNKKRQPSRPRVRNSEVTSCSFSAWRNFAGTIRRPLRSMVCSYSP
jgi:hypothetical protein